MIEESYVSFDTAKLLKEAGFDVVCRSAYYATGNSAVMHERNSMLSPGCISRPTQALAARWLREVYGIHVFSFFQYHTQRWVYYIAKLSAPNSEIGMIFSEKDYDDHEQAMEDGLQEAIKLIKK